MDEASELPTEAHPTTTHAAHGAGNPRLVFTAGSEAWDGSPPREFPLVGEVTRIGSTADMDLQLEGLLPSHAEIRHDVADEYVLYVSGDAHLSSDGAPAESIAGHILRTGARVDLGDWQMSFVRDEFADHGRPFGGRQGGEGEHQQGQPERNDEDDPQPPAGTQ